MFARSRNDLLLMLQSIVNNKYKIKFDEFSEILLYSRAIVSGPAIIIKSMIKYISILIIYYIDENKVSI